MSRLNRAKIFAPFAALAGFDERVRQKEKVYVLRHELDADEEWELNQKLFNMHCLTANSQQARKNMVRVSIEYFEICDDAENDAYNVKGQYHTLTGIVQNVDQHEQHITLQCDGITRVIPFADIYQVSYPAG